MKEQKKSGKDRTQREVRDEVWSDERIKSFLDILPPEGTPTDYNIILLAYRGMLPEMFARFIPFFVEAGRDINVTLEDNTTILDLIAAHRKSSEYADVLIKSGAVKSAARQVSQS